jgi:uncharacterized membrane protein YkvA (DUF1232 family)
MRSRFGAGRARRAVAPLLTQLPRLLRLVVRLVRDPRVSRADKLLLGFVVAYVLTPVDLVPDILAVLGFVDDLFLLGLALDRLLVRAGPAVLLDHWDASPQALRSMLARLDDIGHMLPRTVRRILIGRVTRP